MVKLLALLALASLSLAIPSPLTPDPSGDKNIGNGAGGQFITGACLSNADCGSGCCASPIGICSGPDASFQQGKTGCGFVSSSGTAAPAPAPAPPAASAPASTGGGDLAQTESPDAPGAENVGNGAGKQFITGACTSDADCASGCCANPMGVCSGPGAAFQQGKTGCGFTGPAKF